MTASQPIVWSIAASDSSAGAGCTADLQVLSAQGVIGCHVITAVTAQNDTTLSHCQAASPESVKAQIACLSAQYYPQVIKIGVITTTSVINVVSHFLKNFNGWVVLDPVYRASCGAPLVSDAVLAHAQRVLWPHVDILLPNYAEAMALAPTQATPWHRAAQLAGYGIKTIIIKGGDVANSAHATDWVWQTDKTYCLSTTRLAKAAPHGSGCVFSALLAAALAKGYTVDDAIIRSKHHIGALIAKSISRPAGALRFQPQKIRLNARFFPSRNAHVLPRARLPTLTPRRIGVYPIVPSLAWIKRLQPLAPRLIQLRIKNHTQAQQRDEIIQAIHYCNMHKIRLIINDAWQLACEHRAFGVHLGQDDILQADLMAIARAGCCLGISTHSLSETAIAKGISPSYVAFGPVYHTTSKAMTFAAQGLATLKAMRACWPDTPLVAIGGINETQSQEVAKTGVDGIAVISAITQASDPLRAAQRLQDAFHVTQ